MLLATPAVVIGVLAIAIIIAVIASRRYKNNADYQGSRIHVFASVIGSFVIVFTAVLYFNLVQIHSREADAQTHAELVELDKSIITQLNTQIINAGKYIPAFVLSITPLDNCSCKPKIEEITEGSMRDDDEQLDKSNWKNTLSHHIFYVWSSTATGGKAVTKNCVTYVTRFLQMATSDQLEEIWNTQRCLYSKPTKKFGDLLFEKAKEIENKHNPKEYKNKAKEFVTCKQYHEIKSLSKSMAFF